MQKNQHPIAKPLSLAVAAALTGLGLAMTLVAPAQADIVVTSAQGTITNTTSQNITITNTGAVTGSPTGIYNNGGTIGVLNNNGSIAGPTNAIYNDGGLIGTLSNNGTITAWGNNPSNPTVGIYNSGTIGILNNTGTIIGHSENPAQSYGILNTNFIGTLDNSGLISGDTHVGISNSGTIGSLINTGTITNRINNTGVITTLSNAGTISDNGWVAIYNSGGAINTLINNGNISGNTYGISNTGTISNLINTGTISASSGNSHYDIYNSGTITTLTNGQHGLTYTGPGFLPTNYNTYFASGSYNPGSIFATTVFSSSPIGSITSYGIKLAPTGVILATGVYLGVLSSSSAFTVVNAGQVHYYSANGYSVTYELVAESVADHAYDLDILSFSCSGSCASSSSGNSSSSVVSGITPAVIAQHNNPAYYAARVIDANSTLSNLFSGVSGTVAQSAAASQSLPLVIGGATSVTQTALTSVNTIIDARQSANRGASSGDDFQTKRNMWLKAFGTEADQSDLDGVSGFKAHTGGVTFGADQKINDKLTLGAAFAYANSNVSSTVGGASHGINIKGYQLIGYGSLALNQRDSVDFQLDGGMSNNSGSRDINFADVVANSSYNSWTAHLGSSLNRRYDLNDRLTLTPSLRVDYTRINESGYQESGAGDFDLNVNSQRAEALVFGVDGKLDYKLSDTLALAANLGVGYDAMNKQDSIIAAYAGAPNASFITEGLNQGALISRAGAVLSYKLPKGMEISAHYDVEGRRNYLSQTASVKFSMSF